MFFFVYKSVKTYLIKTRIFFVLIQVKNNTIFSYLHCFKRYRRWVYNRRATTSGVFRGA